MWSQSRIKERSRVRARLCICDEGGAGKCVTTLDAETTLVIGIVCPRQSDRGR
jgi:hypothetical protein